MRRPRRGGLRADRVPTLATYFCGSTSSTFDLPVRRLPVQITCSNPPRPGGCLRNGQGIAKLRMPWPYVSGRALADAVPQRFEAFNLEMLAYGRQKPAFSHYLNGKGFQENPCRHISSFHSLTAPESRGAAPRAISPLHPWVCGSGSGTCRAGWRHFPAGRCGCVRPAVPPGWPAHSPSGGLCGAGPRGWLAGCGRP